MRPTGRSSTSSSTFGAAATALPASTGQSSTLHLIRMRGTRGSFGVLSLRLAFLRRFGRLRILALPSAFPDHSCLQNQRDSRALGDAPLHLFDELLDVVGRRRAGVDDEIRVLLRNLRAADPQTLEPGLLDERARMRALRVAEHGAAARHPERLR